MEAEEDEPDTADAAYRSAAALKPKTLNEDPYNVFAEDLAMEMCKLGFEVAAELLETDLVFTTCGSLVSGTPDGGFRDHQGLLRLVQVVRVPLLPEMDEDEVADILYDTVLTKVVKSQTWMKETATLPHDFTIFCWLPPVGAYRACLEETDALLWTDALIWNLRAGGWPFSLVIQVPEEPGKLFPRNFGFRHFNKEKKDYAPGLSYFLNAADFDSGDDEDDEVIFSWDLDFDSHDASITLDVENETVDAVDHHTMERLQQVLLAIELIQFNIQRHDLQNGHKILFHARGSEEGRNDWLGNEISGGDASMWLQTLAAIHGVQCEISEDLPCASPMPKVEAWEDCGLGELGLSSCLDMLQMLRRSHILEGSDVLETPKVPSPSSLRVHDLECLPILIC